MTYTSGGSVTTNVFATTALGLTQDVHNGARTSLARDPKGVIVAEKTGSGARYNVVTDYQGSVVALISTTGAVAATYKYDPYGGVTASGAAAGDNPFHYLGQYQYGADHILGYRWYFPGWGRFTSRDPTRQEINHYAYAKGDPVNNSDPTGASSIGGNIEACYCLCIGYTGSCGTNHKYGNSISFGFGSPGISGGLVSSSGTPNGKFGVAGVGSCSAGPASFSVSTSGTASGSLGSSLSTPKCSASLSFSF
ncbi:hypothetical protein CU254_27260 [Amycolatopsis sp. AA4]|nr:hypothetical protein CU254_27260 [Amycolatopsis sp. AA4]